MLAEREYVFSSEQQFFMYMQLIKTHVPISVSYRTLLYRYSDFSDNARMLPYKQNIFVPPYIVQFYKLIDVFKRVDKASSKKTANADAVTVFLLVVYFFQESNCIN